MAGRDVDASDLSFEVLVETYYRRLYQFALNLTGTTSEAGDLTQQTFLVWGRKGHQLRDPAKVKSWLFATLHREFLRARRHSSRFPCVEIGMVEDEVPAVEPSVIEEMDARAVMDSFRHVDAVYQAPLALFYMEDYSYREIAEILEVPLGTVQSRISRGKRQLQQILTSAVREKAHDG